jgi:Flp pilus assembly CpaF family ATPase
MAQIDELVPHLPEAIPEEIPEGVRRKLRSLERAYGAEIRSARARPGVTDIHRNQDGKIWVEESGQERFTGAVLSEHDSRKIIQLVADIDGKPIISGEVNANLPTGERFAALIPARGPSSFSIRQPLGKVFTLADYEAAGILSATHAAAIREGVVKKWTILIIGGTGSGKTTLANAIMAEPPFPERRMFFIQDQDELRFTGENAVYAFSGELSEQQLLKASLRRKPRSIGFGEVRDRSALDWVKAARSGHPGSLTTIHAEDGVGGLDRLAFLVAEAEVPPDIARQYVLDAVDLVVVIVEIAGGHPGRRVTEVAKVIKSFGSDGRFQLDHF